MIDTEKAKQTFEKYVKQNYDLTNENIQRKYDHSFRVAQLSKEIVKNSNILFENAESLAELIGLLHDIGRFPQIKQTNSLDDNLMDHAGEGLKILFDNNKIRDYIKDSRYDDIIKSAIYNHSKLEVAPFLSDDEKIFSNILRDADKIDIFKIISESKEVIPSNEIVSENLLSYIRAHKQIPNNLVTNSIDECIKTLAFIFDINYKYSFYLIEENGYIEKIIKKLNIDNNDTIKFIYNEIKNYIRSKIGERYHAE